MTILRTAEEIELSRDYDGIALYSGGTDSTLAPLLAREEVGDNILLVMVDLGESPSALVQAEERASIIGWDLLLLDGREAFGEQVLSEAIRMRADYWGYPLGTPLGRAFQVGVALDLLSRLNGFRARTRYVIHGCAARQNTRYRIERQVTSGGLGRAHGPLVDHVYSRDEKVALLEQYGIRTVPGDGVATDQNIYCRAMEGDLLNTLDDPDSLDIYTVVPGIDEIETTKPTTLTVAFEHGVPVAFDGRAETVAAVVEACNRTGAKLAIGRICVFEDTIPELGYKERGIYEAPAAQLLAQAHAYLEGATLRRADREAFRGVRQRWADAVYRGDWDTSARLELSELGARFNESITGEVTLRLFPGVAEVGRASCDGALLIDPSSAVGAY